ncbi:hypothetical protein GCM10028832_08910 [Streptomyces sparsus]
MARRIAATQYGDRQRAHDRGELGPDSCVALRERLPASGRSRSAADHYFGSRWKRDVDQA